MYASYGTFDGVPILPNHATLGTACLAHWKFAFVKLSIAKIPLRVNNHVDTGYCIIFNSIDIGNETLAHESG